jgi:hypothetical protein
MKKLFGLFEMLLLVGSISFAQTTTVTGTATDSDGTLWVNGTVTVTFVPNPTKPNPSSYSLCSSGAPLSASLLNQGPISLGSRGNFSVATYDNTQVCPSGSQWQFTICPQATSKCGIITTPISGVSRNISTLVDSTIPAPRFPATIENYGYVDAEAILQLVPGNIYYNVTNSCYRGYSGSVWSCVTGSYITPAGVNYSVQYNNAGVLDGAPGVLISGAATLQLGNAGSVQGALNFVNAASGTINIQPPIGPLGAVDLILPTTDGTFALTNGTVANVSGIVATVNGGTGANNAAGALVNLGAYSATNPAGYITNSVTTLPSLSLPYSQLSGTPALPNGTTATTQPTGDNTTNVATDAFAVANGFNAATQIAAAKAKPAIRVFGDSIAQGTGPNNPANGLPDLGLGWANQELQLYGGPSSSNVARGGDSSIDCNNRFIMPTAVPALGSVYYFDTCFTNDVQQWGNSANNLLISQRAEQGMLFTLLTPTTTKNLLQGSTKAGGFTNDGVTYQSAMGVKSTTNGATFSQSITVGSSGVLEGCYMVYNGNTGTFTLQVDGSPQTDPISASTTWISSGDGGAAISTSNSTTQFCAGFRLTGFSAAAHTVLVTQTGAGTVDFQWLGTPAALSTTNPFVLAMDVPQLGIGANQAYTGLYQTIYTNVANFTATDKQNLQTVPARTLLGANPGSSGYWAIDNTHPSLLGTNLLVTSATSIMAAAGYSNSPTVLSNRSTIFDVPTTNDVSQGFTLNSGGYFQVAGWSGLQTHYINANMAIWEGNIYGSTIPEGYVYGQDFASSPGWYWCNWSPANYIHPATAVTGCDMAAGGGKVEFGILTNGKFGADFQASGFSTNYYNTGYPMFFGDTVALAVPGSLTSTPTTSQNSSQLRFQGLYGNGTVGGQNDYTSIQQVYSTGANPSVTLTMTRATSNTGVFGIDFSPAAFFKTGSYQTATVCSSTASPAVCGSAVAGEVQVAAAATTLTINSTAITANTGCWFTYNTEGITAPTNIASLIAPHISSRTAGTSLTITVPVAPLTNPVNVQFGCLN